MTTEAHKNGLVLNVGIIGFGLSGRLLMASFLHKHPGFNLKTVAQNATKTAHLYYPQVVSTLDVSDVINDPSIDVVFVSSPNETHFEYAQRALMAGKHVVIEKPMVTTPEQAEILIELAEKQGKVLTVYQNRRFDGDFKTVRSVINSGLLGEVINYEARFDRWSPLPNPKKWKEVPSLGTGILYDLGSHILDQALFLFGVPRAFSGRVFTQRPHSSIDDAFDVQLDYGRHQVSLKASLLVREPTPRYVVHGTQGSFVKYGIDPQEDQLKAGMLPGDKGFGDEAPAFYGTLNTQAQGLHFQGKVTTETGNFGSFFEQLYAAIVERAPVPVDPRLIVSQIRIMQACKTSRD